MLQDISYNFGAIQISIAALVPNVMTDIIPSPQHKIYVMKMVSNEIRESLQSPLGQIAIPREAPKGCLRTAFGSALSPAAKRLVAVGGAAYIVFYINVRVGKVKHFVGLSLCGDGKGLFGFI